MKQITISVALHWIAKVRNAKIFCVMFAAVLTVGLLSVVHGQVERPNRRELLGLIEDPESFGKSVSFLGTLRSNGFVILDPTCSFAPGDIGPDDRCITLAASPGLTTFNERDLGSVVIPGNSARTNIYMIFSHYVDFEFFNGTGVQQNNARFVYVPYITIEGAALNDPRALDPTTHDPLNGKLDINLSSRRFIDRSLGVNERIHEIFNYSRALIAGVNKTALIADGMPSDIVDKLFRETITIRVNMSGSVRHVTGANLTYNARLMGN